MKSGIINGCTLPAAFLHSLFLILYSIFYKKPLDKVEGFFVVELLGFEPRQTEPKSVVLPLHHNSIL
jgi:hypothetical protein